MGAVVDIFNPQTSVLAAGLEGKVILIYGGNNVGKTYVAARLPKPYFLACESGLNGQSGVKYNKISNWADFRKVVRQLTNASTVDKARELYDTIVIDEVYASSLMCQDFVLNTYGDGALTLADGDGKHNLYQIYEKEYFKMINLLLSRDYTVVFIGHAQEKDKKITPKGDKRCINPIVDNCDFVFYVQSNGVNEKGEVIKSSAYCYQNDTFFARSRFEYCDPVIKEFTAENLLETVKNAVTKQAEKDGAEVVSYEEQKARNTAETEDYETVMNQVQELGQKFIEANRQEELTEIVEGVLGSGKKVSDCNKKQLSAVIVIRDELEQALSN